jgi:hypothetical protein
MAMPQLGMARNAKVNVGEGPKRSNVISGSTVTELGSADDIQTAQRRTNHKVAAISSTDKVRVLVDDGVSVLSEGAWGRMLRPGPLLALIHRIP